ncbi:uncharacterized protein LOC127876058 [Dreissena polymorpha]|uniref:HAT C-terminal dimerisation domain-containing protein n=1 Tax=Dreissena polymorpha TaxID=45954 RepID=A0A9D4KM44_DREPO|nr:uncharacterized protein LOC127876058 [Dreissena polymorpha]KAH3842095.1 hypothetical protein DPMN_115583 [Dreissena polymorpha]
MEVQCLVKHFCLPVGATVSQWKTVRGALSESGKTEDEAMAWVTGNLKESHVNIFKLATIGLLLPMSTADCERGFSTLKQIKTDNRATLSNKVLKALLTVSIKGPSLEVFDFACAVKTGTGPGHVEQT